MNLRVLEQLYPTAHQIVQELLDDNLTSVEAIEGLTSLALERIERGETPRCDARVLLITRHQVAQRNAQKRRRR